MACQLVTSEEWEITYQAKVGVINVLVHYIPHDSIPGHIMFPEFHHADVDVVVEKYNSTLSDILDKHAPLKTRTVTVHPDAPWINDEIKDKKRQKRKAERKWRHSGLTVHKEIYCEERKELNQMISNSKNRLTPHHASKALCLRVLMTF